MKIITGATGDAKHITSNDARGFNKAIFGEGNTIVNYGTEAEFKCIKPIIVDNNTVRLTEGDIVAQGLHAMIEPGTFEIVTIETGTAGKERQDVIGVQYTLDEVTGYESVEIKVSKGTPSTSPKPTYPDDTNADIRAGAKSCFIPLFIVYINELTIEGFSDVADIKQTIADQIKTVDEKLTGAKADISKLEKAQSTTSGQITEITTRLGKNTKVELRKHGTVKAGTKITFLKAPKSKELVYISVGVNVSASDKKYFNVMLEWEESGTQSYMLGYYYDANYNASICLDVTSNGLTINSAWSQVTIKGVKQTDPDYNVFIYDALPAE